MKGAVKWPLIILPAFLVGAFEYWRHALFDGFPQTWGNLAAAGIACAGSYVYYRYTLSVLERLNASLHEEKSRQALMDERDRIAGQLHDSLAQTLFFLNAELRKAEAHLERGELDHAARSMREATEGVAFAHQDLRETIAALRKSEWDRPLLPSLRNLANAFYRQSGIQIDVALPQNLPDLPAEARRAIYRIAQEALTNVRKHAMATRAELTLDATESELRLRVVDDGVGFAAEDSPQGIGIAEMERLAEEVGGFIAITGHGRGTTVELTAPL